MEKKINVHGIKINPKDIQQFLLKEGVKDDINSIGMLISFNTQRLGYIKISPKTKKIFSNTKETWDKTERKHLSSFLENQKQIEISSSPRNIITKLNLSFYKKDEQDKKIPYENLVLTLCKDDEEQLYFMYKNKNAGIQVSKLKEKKKENKNIEIQVAKAEENKTEKKINARKITINPGDIKDFLIREGVNDDIDSIYMLMSFNNKKGMQGEKLSDLLKHQKSIEIYSGFYNTIKELEMSFYREDEKGNRIPYDKLVLTLYEDHKEKLYFMYKNQNAGIQVSKLEEQKKENKNTEIKVAKEKENQQENENNNKFQVIRAKNRGIEKNINAHRIIISLNDIKTFLRTEGGLEDIDSIYMGMLINKKITLSRKIGTMPKSRQEIRIKSNEGKPIDKLALVFYRLSENREIIQYGRLVLILHKDENEQLYFMCENSKAKIKVIQVENRDMDKRINARKITINLEDIRNFLTQERGLNDIDSVLMLISLISANHQKRGIRKKLSHLLKSQKQIEISCDSNDVIKELEMSFYRKDEKDSRIPYEKSVLTLYKDENKKLYFMCENREAAIRVARVEEDKKENKNNENKNVNESAREKGVAFGKNIFGKKIDDLVNTMFKNNNKNEDVNKSAKEKMDIFKKDISKTFVQTKNNPEKKTLLLEDKKDPAQQAYKSQDTDKNFKIQIQGADVKKFLEDNKVGQQDFQNIYIMSSIGTLIKDKNGKRIEEINIGNLEDSSCINIECYGNIYMLVFFHKYGQDTSQMKKLTLKLQKDDNADSGFSIFYAMDEKRGQKTGIKAQKVQKFNISNETEDKKESLKSTVNQITQMAKKINVPGIKIDLDDIRNFLTTQGILNDIKSINMEVQINQGESYAVPISNMHKDRKYLVSQSLIGNIIDELEVYFFERDKDGKEIKHENLSLTLYKNESEELYFKCGNKTVKIKVAPAEENKKENKNQENKNNENKNNENKNVNESVREKGGTFGKHIFFGRNAKHLIHSILQNNNNFLDFNSVYVSINAISQNNKSDKKFIDLKDATNEFQYFFAYKCGDVMNMTPYESFSLNDSDKDIVFQNDKNLKIDILRMLIRHNNYENLVEDYGQQDNYRWRQRGYYEIEIEENNYGTGFKYKLVDRNGHIISYGVDYDEKGEVENLTDYLSDKYEDSNGKEFIERFNLATARSDVVLKDTAKGITLTDKNSPGMRCVCLGTDTKLTFTNLFIDAIKDDEKFSNKFYVLTKSQALKRIINYILGEKHLPFKSLSFINQEIVESYDTKKSIGENLNGKDMVTLRVDDIKIDPKLESNKFSADLNKLHKIDDGFQCAVALIDLLSKIQAPNSNFKYQLNSVKDGKSILETRDIFKPDVSKTLVQAQNNTEEKTSWLEAKKAQAFKLQPEPSENNNSNNKPFSEL